MLAGKKPLSCFADGEDFYPEVVSRYLRLFDRHVAAGRFIRRDHYSEMSWGRCHRIFYALPNEEWRIGEMIELLSSIHTWSADKERREGELLGYADWMNDYWLSNVYVK
ncbi:hypothetical protein [Sphingorhabdus lacus]|uniref:Uncharacterized protein n=1 Tax=Sphingorhabdus lacus TaxID=392610 RepID=A0A6I6LCX2_9SPHN|nr:hypothetical protein [Sphingorhabdus lacus]QGY81856.1 hypothetical protein EUU25_15285 [Sphingorhabdus lacus]